MNILKKSVTYALCAMTLVGGALLTTGYANAQTASMTTMPAIYNQAGIQVNNGNVTPLPAGYYYLAPGAQPNTEIYYYGDGTYFDSTTGLYGGSVKNPNGTAGVSIPGFGAAPGAPDTGAGGNAVAAWMTLIISGLVAIGGVAYLTLSHRRSVPSLR